MGFDFAAGLAAAVSAGVFAADLAAAAFVAAVAVDFPEAVFAAALAAADFAPADCAEALAVGFGAAVFAAGCRDEGFAAAFEGADFADLAAADFAVAGFAAVLDLAAAFDAAGLEALAADLVATLFDFADADLAALGGFAVVVPAGFAAPAFLGLVALDFVSVDLGSGAVFIVLANGASLVFPMPDFVVCSRPSQLFRPPSKCCKIEPKTIVPTMYCDKAAARKPCLCVSHPRILSCRSKARAALVEAEKWSAACLRDNLAAQSLAG
jgi:hypothetical protein